MNRSASDIFRLEHEIITKCGISKERFRKVSGSQWENIYIKRLQKNMRIKQKRGKTVCIGLIRMVIVLKA